MDAAPLHINLGNLWLKSLKLPTNCSLKCFGFLLFLHEFQWALKLKRVFLNKFGDFARNSINWFCFTIDIWALLWFMHSAMDIKTMEQYSSSWSNFKTDFLNPPFWAKTQFKDKGNLKFFDSENSSSCLINCFVVETKKSNEIWNLQLNMKILNCKICDFVF